MSDPLRCRAASAPARTAVMVGGVIAAIALAVVACGDAGGADAQFEARLDAVEALAQARCDASAQCGCTPSAAQGGCDSGLRDDWRARVIAGRDRGLQYDQDCVDAIADAIEAQGCAWPGVERNPCDDFCQVFHGDRGAGEHCDGFDLLVSDCAQGLLCEGGRCIAPCARLSGLAEGETCRDAASGQALDRCAEGLECDFAAARCVRPASVGESCAVLPCDGTSWCDNQSLRCAPRAGEAQNCDFVPCTEGLTCHYGPPDYIGVCVTEPREGESCAEVGCSEDLWCDGNAICRARAAKDQPCYDQPCAEGLVCSDAFACIEPPAAGQPCAQGECEAGAFCDFTVAFPTCVAGAAVAEPCSGHRQCASGYCPAGYCDHPPQRGESCERTLVCAIGTSCDGSVCRASVTHGPAVCVYEAW